jgi:hypothetical protein
MHNSTLICAFIVYTPNPDKPKLNIDPPAAEILKICGIASGFAFGYDLTGRSVFYSIWLWHKSCANMM